MTPEFFFVHPRSGVLVESKRLPRKKKARARLQAQRPDVRVLSPTKHLRRVRGIWYAVTIGVIPSYGSGHVRDVIARVKPNGSVFSVPDIDPVIESLRDLWDRGRYASAMRQLSKREIRQLLG